MLCPECGFEISEDSPVCPNCGNTVTSQPDLLPDTAADPGLSDEYWSPDAGLKGYMSYTNAVPSRTDDPEPEAAESSEDTDDPASRKDWMAYVAIISGALSIYSAPMVFSGALLGLTAVAFGILGMFSRKRALAAVGIAAGAAGLGISLLFASLFIKVFYIVSDYLMGGFGFRIFGGW